MVIKPFFNKGDHYENIAKVYLENEGLLIIQQNYHCRFGEIDLIMKDNSTICFIEVKYRETMSHGGAIHAISQSKQHKLIKAASFYIMENQNISNSSFRFDTITLQGNSDGNPDINWIQNAFYAE